MLPMERHASISALWPRSAMLVCYDHYVWQPSRAAVGRLPCIPRKHSCRLRGLSSTVGLQRSTDGCGRP